MRSYAIINLLQTKAIKTLLSALPAQEHTL